MHRPVVIIMMVVGHQIVHDDILATCFAPAFQHGDEITMALKPLHLDYACGTDRNDQAERVLRPLARRRLITARPERVRMRRRKPCFMWRRRLFGWNVRLPFATLILLEVVRRHTTAMQRHAH